MKITGKSGVPTGILIPQQNKISKQNNKISEVTNTSSTESNPLDSFINNLKNDIDSGKITPLEAYNSFINKITEGYGVKQADSVKQFITEQIIEDPHLLSLVHNLGISTEQLNSMKQ